jgi:hypothetical protein
MGRIVKLLMVSVSFGVSGIFFADSLADQSLPTVSIYTPTSIVSSGSPVELRLKIVNVSSSAISFIEVPHTEGGSHFGVAYEIKLIAPNGEAKTFFGISRGSLKSVTLDPGDTLQEGISLSDKFDMTDIGKYTVEILPLTSTADGFSTTFSSNTVVITVIRQ